MLSLGRLKYLILVHSNASSEAMWCKLQKAEFCCNKYFPKQSYSSESDPHVFLSMYNPPEIRADEWENYTVIVTIYDDKLHNNFVTPWACGIKYQ